MDIRNKILIISDIPEQIKELRQKLSGLQSTYLIYNAKIENAFATANKFIPDVVIVYTNRINPAKYIKFCRSLKTTPTLKNTSILFIFQEFNENFVLSSFDAGITDYITIPLHNADILTRVLWAFQKKEKLDELEKKENTLKFAGVIDKNNEIYTNNYVEYALKSAIETANKYHYPIVLIAIALDQQFNNPENFDYLGTIIKKSTRKTDIVGLVSNRNYFILLNRTDLNGAHIVYNKIIDKLGDLSVSVGMNLGICEENAEINYQDLVNFSLQALNEAYSSGGNRVVVFDPAQTKENNPHINVENNHHEASENNSSKSWLNKLSSSKKQYENFSHQFNQKVDFVIEPVFHKVHNYLIETYPKNLMIDHYTGESKCVFSVRDESTGNSATLQIIDPGTSKIIIDHSFITMGRQNNNRRNMDIHDLTNDNLEAILKHFFNEFHKINLISKM